MSRRSFRITSATAIPSFACAAKVAFAACRKRAADDRWHLSQGEPSYIPSYVHRGSHELRQTRAFMNARSGTYSGLKVEPSRTMFFWVCLCIYLYFPCNFCRIFNFSLRYYFGRVFFCVFLFSQNVHRHRRGWWTLKKRQLGVFGHVLSLHTPTTAAEGYYHS